MTNNVKEVQSLIDMQAYLNVRNLAQIIHDMNSLTGNQLVMLSLGIEKAQTALDEMSRRIASYRQRQSMESAESGK